MSAPSHQVVIIALLHIVTIVSIALNIPVVRQVSCFVYLMLVPGFAIMKVLKLGKNDAGLTVLFSVSLSIAFLMFTGLLVNEFYPLIGVSKPLSIVPLTTTLVGLTMILLFVGYRSDIARVATIDSAVHISKKNLFKVFLFVLPPALGAVGALYDYTAVLLFMIVAVALLWTLAIFSRKFLPEELYPLLIVATGLALLLHTTLISRYNLGNDVNAEYYTFRMTEIQGYWKKPGFVTSESQLANFQSDLSVTILPTIFSVLLNIDGELIFKLIFAFFLSLVPLVLYRVCELQIGKSYALASAFFFMSVSYGFYGTEPLAVGRQIVAELFFMLSVFLIVNKEIELQKRKILFIVFGVALIVSHYSIAYIYLLYIIFAYVFSYRHRDKTVLGIVGVLFLCTCIFSWYVFISDSPMLALTRSIENMYNSFLIDLLKPAARSSTVFTYLNPTTASSVVGLAHRLLVYVQNFFIAIGIAVLVIRKEVASFAREYKYMSILAMLILLASLAVPRLAPTLNFTRFYGITMLLLAPFFVLGGTALLGLIKRSGFFILSKSRILRHKSQDRKVLAGLSLKIMTVVLIITFLFQVGFVNRITRSDPLSISLDLDRRKTTSNVALKISFYEVYIPEQDAFSARWYSNNVNQQSLIYADYIAKENVLTAYALVDRNMARILSNATILKHGNHLYLRLLNVYYDIVVTDEDILPTHNFSSLFNEGNKIYSNGASELYYTP